MKTKITAILAMVMLLSLFVSVAAFAGTINYTYDNAGRLTGADYGSSKTIAYTYDNNGNMLQRVVITNIVSPGDVDDSRDINLADAIIALKIMTGINSSESHSGADVNGDGKIGLSEAIYILQKVSGVR
ncbi:MAG: dockerin type I domain-containing protein [Thermodesulfobacteriota bacterium]|nr:dockerin type I domain-containing protein [Thermodesulfobacteriota bacterium]